MKIIKNIKALFIILATALLITSCGYVEEENVLPSYYADSDAPVVVSVTPADGSVFNALSLVEINYSEAVVGADTAANYAFSGDGAGSLAVDSVSEVGINAYSIVVSGAPGDGGIVLTISNVTDLNGNGLSGNIINYTGAVTAPVIVSVTPEDGSVFNTLSLIEITYSEEVVGADTAGNYAFSGDGAGSLTVDSVSVTGMNEYSLSVMGTPGEGSIVLTISNVTDLVGNALLGNTVNYTGDTTPPEILIVDPEDGSKVDGNALAQIDITYSEEVVGADSVSNYAFSGGGVGSLTINSVTETGMNEYSLSVTGTPGDGSITLTISNITDQVGHVLTGNTITYTGWWNTGWSNRRKLVFDNSGQLDNLVNFPVLVRINSTRIDYSKTQNSGEDIRFVDSDMTGLSYEIEKWNESGESTVWVTVPQIDGSSTTDYIWMYYGNSGVSDAQNEENVWDSDYLGVWHLSESSGLINDSTSINNDATNIGAIYTLSGKIDGAYDFNGDGDVIETSSYTYNFDAEITLEAWFKYSGPGTGSPRILEISKLGDANSHCLAPDGDGSLRAWLESATGSRIASADDSNNYDDGEWHYMVYTYSNPNGILYVDGNVTATASGSSSDLDDGPYFIIGAISDGSGTYAHSQHEFDGFIDEVRISDIARSADWIAAQYASMNDSFISFGDEE